MLQVQGSLGKMHKTRLAKHLRLVHLDPISGLLATFKSPENFPHQPHEIIHLDAIESSQFAQQKRLYHRTNFFYMKVVSKEKTIVFFDKDLNIIRFMLSQIETARKFYAWLQSIVKLRYSVASKGNSLACSNKSEQTHADIADELIKRIL